MCVGVAWCGCSGSANKHGLVVDLRYRLTRVIDSTSSPAAVPHLHACRYILHLVNRDLPVSAQVCHVTHVVQGVCEYHTVPLSSAVWPQSTFWWRWCVWCVCTCITAVKHQWGRVDAGACHHSLRCNQPLSAPQWVLGSHFHTTL